MNPQGFSDPDGEATAEEISIGRPDSAIEGERQGDRRRIIGIARDAQESFAVPVCILERLNDSYASNKSGYCLAQNLGGLIRSNASVSGERGYSCWKLVQGLTPRLSRYDKFQACVSDEQ